MMYWYSKRKKTQPDASQGPSWADKMAEAKDKSALQRQKRRKKAFHLWGAHSRGIVRNQLWDAFSLYIRIRDRKLNGGRCMVGKACLGLGLIEVAYHIEPQVSGDATRYDEECVVGSCAACNYGEQCNRKKYRIWHIEKFGSELVNRLEEKSRTIKQYTTAELVEKRDYYRRKLEGL